MRVRSVVREAFEIIRESLPEAAIGRCYQAPEETRQRIETLLAALGHALDFWTWHSLAREWDLTDEGAIELMVGLARSSMHG